MNISNLVGRNDNFLAKARKLSILLTSLDFFDNGNTIYVFSMYQSHVEPKFSHKRIRHTCKKFVRVLHIRVKISYENGQKCAVKISRPIF